MAVYHYSDEESGESTTLILWQDEPSSVVGTAVATPSVPGHSMLRYPQPPDVDPVGETIPA